MFGHGKHLCWFTSVAQAIEAVGYWLGEAGKRERIAEAGRAEVVASHTWDHRIAEILEYARKGER